MQADMQKLREYQAPLQAAKNSKIESVASIDMINDVK